jgi:GH15 family glucan-1,4-alpha-glucosidase
MPPIRAYGRRSTPYRAEDGLEGDEGAFLLCTFWLAEAQAIHYANDVGLPGEEVESASRELLGTFPQAFSHIGLVNAAW